MVHLIVELDCDLRGGLFPRLAVHLQKNVPEQRKNGIGHDRRKKRAITAVQDELLAETIEANGVCHKTSVMTRHRHDK